MMVLTTNKQHRMSLLQYILEVFVFLDFLIGHCSTITSLGRIENDKNAKRKSEREVPTAWQQVGLLYLDDKMTASAGTKSLPFTLITSPTSTCENKVITSGHS